ncbi:MAG: hypothetical protein OSA47_11090, partial [Novosphingopyxis baekryungensis]|nr:hypothetical protein [Novosphingopyxis baekryungensis]
MKTILTTIALLWCLAAAPLGAQALPGLGGGSSAPASEPESPDSSSAISMTIRPYESLWKVLGEHFADPRLRQLFARYSTYCGSSPFDTPAT